MKSHTVLSCFSILLLVFIIVATTFSCITIVRQPTAQTPGNAQPQTSLPENRNQGPTGTISVGQQIQAVSQSIESVGGTITVSKPGDPLDGFSITVPPKSFSDSRTFKVSYAPVTSQTFGKDFNAISPLITVDNGGGYSDEVMTVKVPVKIPPDQFAMGFFYDEKSRKLEGIPIVAMDSNSITIATRHFSSFVVSSIYTSYLLKGEINTGFEPGKDDWQIENMGSYITPNGECAGQTLSSLWYYYEKYLSGAGHLWDISDNNGTAPKTPELWPDDSLGYRLASIVQFDYKAYINPVVELTKALNSTDERTHLSFAYAMLLTGQPQQVGIVRQKTAAEGGGFGGHALIVYRLSPDTLWVADPNWPGQKDRTITLQGGTYKPYNSAENKNDMEAGLGKNYTIINYCAKTAMIDWSKLSARWTEYENRSIGNDKFPKWVLSVKDNQDKLTALADMETSEKVLTVKAPQFPDITYGAFVDGKPINTTDSKITLKPGNNKIGFLIYGMVNNKWKYIDFKYYNITYKEKEEPKIIDSGKIKGTVQFNNSVRDPYGCSAHTAELWGPDGKKVISPVYSAATTPVELAPGEYILKYSCGCNPKNAPAYYPAFEKRFTVPDSGTFKVVVTCPDG
jgi:hypothetical protein